VCDAFAVAECDEVVPDALFDDTPVGDGLDLDGLDGDLRWRTRAFGGEAPAGAGLGGAALWGGALGVAAPLSGRLPAPRVVLLFVVMTSPEE
jgi:hypothetical protein